MCILYSSIIVQIHSQNEKFYYYTMHAVPLPFDGNNDVIIAKYIMYRSYLMSSSHYIFEYKNLDHIRMFSYRLKQDSTVTKIKMYTQSQNMKVIVIFAAILVTTNASDIIIHNSLDKINIKKNSEFCVYSNSKGTIIACYLPAGTLYSSS